MNKINECIITKTQDSIQYFKLNKIPIVNNLCDTRQQSLNVQKYDISLQYFKESGLHCLTQYINSDVLFNHYVFKTGVSTEFKDHCMEMSQYLKTMVDINESTQFLDIGGNDGTLLVQFRNNIGMGNYTNIQPSNLYKQSLQNNIETFNMFFNEQFLKMTNHKKYDVITTTNVFQHLYDIDEFVKNVKLILNTQGIWILQFPYWVNGLLTSQFDQIYHQHIYFHTVSPLNVLFAKYDLQIVDATEQYIHGGSMRLVIAHKNMKRINNNVPLMLFSQRKLNMDLILKDFNRCVNLNISESLNLINKLKSQGKKIYGYGASAKGCVYLNQAKLNYTHLDFIIDDTPCKINKFMPGVGIKIVSKDILLQDPPDVVIILSHNVKRQISKKIKQMNSNIKIYVLLPKLELL